MHHFKRTRQCLAIFPLILLAVYYFSISAEISSVPIKISVFAAIKPPSEHFSPVEIDQLFTRQYNAIKSWMIAFDSLNVEIYLFGNQKFNERFLFSPNIHSISIPGDRNQTSPVFSEMLEQVRMARDSANVFMLVNADIVFTCIVSQAVKFVAAQFPEKPFLMVGQRFNIPSDNRTLEFNEDWEEKLYDLAHHNEAFLQGVHYKDYFIFSEKLWNKKFPEFYQEAKPVIMGRAGYDDWIMKSATFSGAAVIDLTPAVNAYHLIHSYNHLGSEGFKVAWLGPEAMQNYAYLGDGRVVSEIDNAPFELNTANLHPFQKSCQFLSRKHSPYTEQEILNLFEFVLTRRIWATIKTIAVTTGFLPWIDRNRYYVIITLSFITICILMLLCFSKIQCRNKISFSALRSALKRKATISKIND